MTTQPSSRRAPQYAELRPPGRRLETTPRWWTLPTVALAGTVYRAWSDTLEDNPRSPELWDRVLAENVKARAGKFGRGSLLIGVEAQRKASMEERFGAMVDATLSRECLIVDEASRQRLIEEVALALDQAALKLRQNAKGDFRADETALRFPAWSGPKSTGEPTRKLGLVQLFDQWAKHPEQKEQAPKTVSRYRGVFEALETFLKGPEASKVTIEDLRRFTDALMVERKIAPRTVRDVYKAAISSVFNWAVGKAIVPGNPIAGIVIKVKKSVALRQSGLTDAETFALVSSCLGMPETKAKCLTAAQRWCPLICLYTGARIGEVTQLRKEDFRQNNKISFLRITPEAGSVKDREYRDVPIHPRLVSLGLLEFIHEAAAGPLFFDPKASRRSATAKTSQAELVAKSVSEWSKQTCLKDPLLVRPMHGLRHRFMTLARNAGLDPQYIEVITGHASSGQNSRYGSFDIETLMREMRRLNPDMVEGKKQKT